MVSLLDRLKREAEQQRARQEAEARDRELREDAYRTGIEPRMRALADYLQRLTEMLAQLKPEVTVRMPLRGYGDLIVCPQWDIKLEQRSAARSFLLTMHWTMRVDPDRCPELRAEGAILVRALMEAFHQLHLGGIRPEKRNARGDVVAATFHPRGKLKASAQFSISAEDPILRMTFENVSWMGVSRRQIDWQRVDEGLHDRIGRYIARDDDSLFTERLSDEMRSRLRDRDPRSASARALEARSGSVVELASEPSRSIASIDVALDVASPAAKAAPELDAEAVAQLAAPPLPPSDIQESTYDAGSERAEIAIGEQSTSARIETEEPASIPDAQAEAQPSADQVHSAEAEEALPIDVVVGPGMVAAPSAVDDKAPIPFESRKLDAAAFMLRMSVTLSQLRDEDEDEDQGESGRSA